MCNAAISAVVAPASCRTSALQRSDAPEAHRTTARTAALLFYFYLPIRFKLPSPLILRVEMLAIRSA